MALRFFVSPLLSLFLVEIIKTRRMPKIQRVGNNKNYQTMKKVIVLVGIAICGLLLTSCKKEKTCECVMSYTPQYMPDVTTQTTITEGKCSDMNTKSTTQGVTATLTCKEI